MDNIEQKIEQALDVLTDIKQAIAPDDLWEKTARRIAEKKTAKLVPMRTVWAIAAALAFLVVANISFLSSPIFKKEPRMGAEKSNTASAAISALYIQKVGI